MRNKKKAGCWMLLLESLVVKGSNHGLSDARKCQGTDEYFLNAETWGQKQKDRPLFSKPRITSRSQYSVFHLFRF